jgi:hypothetical protein
MKITRSLTRLANPISWVMHIMVMPSWASCTMTSSTSPTISGSSADVGSSNSMTMGSMLSARAMATRCCWPPESWPGYLSLWGIKPTRSSIFRPRALASVVLRRSTLTCASVRFSVTLRCGNSSKCWKTMPTRARSLGRFVFGFTSEIPSTTMSPCWIGSSALTVLISVDLPEPDGPQTTTTSPLTMRALQSASTWKLPYHLDTFWMSITTRLRISG